MTTKEAHSGQHETMNGTSNDNASNKDKKLLNQFGDYEDTKDMTVKDWEYRWGKSQTQFHMPKVHPMLQKHIGALTGGKKNLRFFIPLCGKSLDMKWLLDEGHEVVGLEGVEQGCKDFFIEQNIPYTIENLKNCQGKVLKATDGSKISLYCCDFFDLDRLSLGTFDCIWDRGSFVAIGTHLRKKYSNIMTPLMKKETKYLLDCFLVDNTIFGGPPFDCNECDVRENFGKICSVERVDERDAMTKWQESWGIKSFTEQVYMLNRK